MSDDMIVLSLASMSDQDKRILNFGDRLAIDRAVKELGNVRNAYELDQRARELASKGKPALKALLRYLDASDPALRGGLGRLAQHLDPEIAIPALRIAAMDESRSDAARLNAVMILERYLGQEIDPVLAQRIPASYDVARESGEEAIAIAETEPLVLVEYADQLLDEPPEIVQAVIQVIKDMDDPRRARLLMAVAAYGDLALQSDIISALGAIQDPLAVYALQTLWHLTTPELRPLVQRQLQKLRMVGVSIGAQGALRALWSPVNAQGYSFLWFIHAHADDPNRGDLLTLILHDESGLVYASAYPDLDLNALPMPAPKRTVHRVRMMDSHHQVLLVELDPALGLRILDEALDLLVAHEAPWPGEIVVFGHWLWADRTLPPREVAWPNLPKPASPVDEKILSSLLEEPPFTGWIWLLPEFDALIARRQEKALRKDGSLHEEVIDILLDGANRSLLGNRLLQQARWLHLAREVKTASVALAVHRAVEAGDRDHPFIRELAWRSLISAAADRAMRRTLRMLSPD